MASNPQQDFAALDATFEDFDLEQVFKKAERRATKRTSTNFVVEFGPQRARIAFDLSPFNVQRLMKRERDALYPIQWINIWDPTVQSEAVTAIGERYNFSERLVRIMCLKTHSQKDGKRRPKDRDSHLSKHRPKYKDPEKDVETRGESSAQGLANGGHSATEGSRSIDFDDDGLELYYHIKDSVNYFSTDQTQKAFCIGAHWLHRRPTLEGGPPPRSTMPSLMPPKHWQWLALCNDHTVLSIHEAPTFELTPEKADEQKWQNDELKNMRANTLDVLLQLSKHGFDLYKRKPLALNSVRRPLNKWVLDRLDLGRHETGMSFASNGEEPNMNDEGTGNLFYYLFEDYVAADPLKTAGAKLEDMSRKILESARPHVRSGKIMDIIPTLHYLNKDLRELKHLFENYKNLIDKIMAAGRPESPSNGGGDASRKGRTLLSDSAVSRFERLRDRLRYLMLNTIEGYLIEIGALSGTYFNLTQQKDSQATARLTRSATLLAKLSVFFLPISFLTSYFSVQIEDLYIYWHGTDYWYAFAVIATLSFVGLFFFGRLLMFFSDVMDEWSFQTMNAFRRLCQRIGIMKIRPDDET